MLEKIRQHANDATKKRVIHLLKLGDSVSQITSRLHVDASYVKRCRAEIRKSQMADKAKDED